MKRLFLIPLMIVLASVLIFSGCGQTAEIEEKEANLLITINVPLEWAGKERTGTFLLLYQLVEAAAQSDDFASVSVFYGPEASDLSAEGALAAMPSYGLYAVAEGENLAEVSRSLKNEFGVQFFVAKLSTDFHEITVADFITPVNASEYAEIVADADKIVGF